MAALCTQKHTKLFTVCCTWDLPGHRRTLVPPRHWCMPVLWARKASDNHGAGKLLKAFHHGDAPNSPGTARCLSLWWHWWGKASPVPPHASFACCPQGWKELLKEHLVSEQGWFSLVPFTCSRNSEVTDGSVYCIAVASPASFALIQVWQHRTIPPIHKILGFSLFSLTLVFEWYWFILMNGLAILWQITRWHGVRGREAKPFFFLLQFSPKLGVNYGLQLMMKCWGCRNILLTQQKEQSTSFSKKQYFFVF